uniref:Transmembrane protein n=1 Tax=Globodera pallida TaxID=36090 RepID=A0A183BTQ5_GLOPA
MGIKKEFNTFIFEVELELIKKNLWALAQQIESYCIPQPFNRAAFWLSGIVGPPCQPGTPEFVEYLGILILDAKLNILKKELRAKIAVFAQQQLHIDDDKDTFRKKLDDLAEIAMKKTAPLKAIITEKLDELIASIGINIANFVCPACDLSNLAPKYISWHNGGLLAAFVALLLTPWNWYDKPAAIRYTLGLIGALMGPLYGIVMSGYYIIAKQKVRIIELYSTRRDGHYWYSNGFNPNAIIALAISGSFSIVTALVPAMLARPNLDIQWVADFSWFVGSAIGFCAFAALESINPKMKLAKAIGQDGVNANA